MSALCHHPLGMPTLSSTAIQLRSSKRRKVGIRILVEKYLPSVCHPFASGDRADVTFGFLRSSFAPQKPPPMFAQYSCSPSLPRNSRVTSNPLLARPRPPAGHWRRRRSPLCILKLSTSLSSLLITALSHSRHLMYKFYEIVNSLLAPRPHPTLQRADLFSH